MSTSRHHPYAHPRHAAGGGSSTAGGSGANDAFTPAMRDRQARGKDPYRSSDASDASDMSDRDSRGAFKKQLPSNYKDRNDGEGFSRAERCDEAIAMLDSPELLMMYAISTNNSVAGARLHWMKIMCGFDDETLEEESIKAEARAGRSTRDTDKRRGGGGGGDRAVGR